MAKQPKNDQIPTWGLWEAIKKKAVDHTATVLVLGGASVAGLAATATWAALKEWTVIDTPAGVVIASVNPCEKLPGRWSLFEEAGGRFIVGAGPHKANPGVTRSYAAFTAQGDSPPTGFQPSTGGEEGHVLTVDELPSHTHSNGEYNLLLRMSNGTFTATVDNTPNEPNVVKAEPLAAVGKGDAHNTIPPYIALYFCKKE